jgi:ATP-binding cassette, subfamily B, bacterial
MSEKTDNPELVGPDPTTTRFLKPDMCRIHLGTHGALHVTVMNERIYGGIYAAYVFPVAHPNEYISLMYAIEPRKEVEIGIIRNLDQFPPADAELVRQALARRYFVHAITRINHIGWKYGFLALDVETDKGPSSFFMHWSYDRAVDYGRRGKILLDVDDNRYLIGDIDDLSPHEREEFQRYIYW